MNPPLYRICQLAQGHIFMMPKPNSETLEQDIRYYQSQGINIIVNLLKDAEINELGLAEESKTCEQYGLKMIHFPVKDMDVPNLNDLQQLNQQLKSLLESGQNISIHCHGGRGRAGTVAITLMMEFGYTAEEAIKIAQTGRQDPQVPVCDLQRAFVFNY